MNTRSSALCIGVRMLHMWIVVRMMAAIMDAFRRSFLFNRGRSRRLFAWPALADIRSFNFCFGLWRWAELGWTTRMRTLPLTCMDAKVLLRLDSAYGSGLSQVILPVTVSVQAW